MTNTLSHPFAVGRTAEVFDWKDGTVLKLYRDWCPSNWVDHEAHIAEVVTQAGLPAPHAFGVVEVNGRRGVVYERVNGESMLQAMRRQPFKMAAFGQMLADLHFEMHRQPVTTLPDQHAQLERSIKEAKRLPDDLRAAALKALSNLPGGDRLCHGDFHPDNIVMTPKGPRIIDWMTANQGNPWADVARTHLLLTLGQPPGNAIAIRLILLARGVFYRGYMLRYQSLTSEGREQLPAWIPIMAAARLNEDIANENAALLRIVRSGLASAQL